MRGRGLWLLMVVACGLPACSRLPGKFQRALVAEIEGADRIELTEHSNELDFLGSKGIGGEAILQFEYDKTDLSPENRQRFLDELGQMYPALQTEFASCLFVDHHTMRFYDGDELSSTMRICFKCGEVAWDKSDEVMPGALMRVLSGVVERAGMEPRDDWEKRAEDWDVHTKRWEERMK